MPSQTADFLKILETLVSFDVRFVVVGGVCAVLHGAPVTTFDVDVVYAMDDENLDAAERALLSIGAHYRGRGSQRLLPSAKRLKGGGHHLFSSEYGPVDFLSYVGEQHTYEYLVDRSEVFRLDSVDVQVLGLAALIEVKSETMRDKDEIHLRILRQVLEQGNKG